MPIYTAEVLPAQSRSIRGNVCLGTSGLVVALGTISGPPGSRVLFEVLRARCSVAARGARVRELHTGNEVDEEGVLAPGVKIL